MIKHEQKFCQRCKASFECKVGSIALCQCSSIILDDNERDYIRENFNDCLCVKCMKEIKSEFHFKKLLSKMKRLLRMT
ncbi:MAG TPA: cysteine-rich CWC family protein [Cyclobacteriaceae bacterium]|nr:cysteine-rich CWC family protein [Cyclobacteriaceae bacterium]